MNNPLTLFLASVVFLALAILSALSAVNAREGALMMEKTLSGMPKQKREFQERELMENYLFYASDHPEGPLFDSPHSPVIVKLESQAK